MCLVTQDKECGRAIMATEELAKTSERKLSETINQVTQIDNKVTIIGLAVDKLVSKHEKEEQDIINRLKEKLAEKDEEMAEKAEEAQKKKELADTRRWQVIVLGLTTFFSVAGSIILALIMIKSGLGK
jgi:ADP-ribosylglycohydrolase